MDIAKEFATDEKLEMEGRWVDFDEATKFKIARMGNPAYSRLISRLFNANKAVLNGKGKSADDMNEKVMAEVFGKSIVVGWEGPVAIDGVDIGAYSQSNSIKVCGFKEFRAWASAHANDVEAFKLHQEAEDEGN